MKKESIQINLLHIVNDGCKASLLLFLPFIAKEFMISLTKVGLLGSAANSLEIFLALPASHIASKIGGKKVLAASLLFCATGYLLTGLSFHFNFIIISFVIAGIGFGIFHPVAFALVAKLFEKKKRGKQLGNFTALGDLGRVGISSFITVVIVSIGWRNTTMAVASILFFLGLYFIHLIKKDVAIEIEPKETLPSISYMDVLKNKKFILSTLCFCLDTLASGSLYVFIPFLLLQRHVPYIFLGMLTSTFFIGNIFGKLFLGRLVDRFGNTKVFILSELCMAFFIILLSNAVWLPLIIFSSILLGIFTKGTIPVLTAMVVESVEHRVGMEKAFGLNAMFVGVASTIAPFALGFFSDKFGITAAFGIAAGFAVIATIPALLFSRVE